MEENVYITVASTDVLLAVGDPFHTVAVATPSTLVEVSAATTSVELSAETTMVVEVSGGLPGPPGPTGPPGGHYVHTQAAPASTWTITHNLGRRPAVVLFESASPLDPVETDKAYPDLNTVIIDWPTPTSGWAYL